MQFCLDAHTTKQVFRGTSVHKSHLALVPTFQVGKMPNSGPDFEGRPGRLFHAPAPRRPPTFDGCAESVTEQDLLISPKLSLSMLPFHYRESLPTRYNAIPLQGQPPNGPSPFSKFINLFRTLGLTLPSFSTRSPRSLPRIAACWPNGAPSHEPCTMSCSWCHAGRQHARSCLA